MEEYDLDQGARIVHLTFISEKMAIRFFSIFWGREDVMLDVVRMEVIFRNVIIDGM